MMKTKSIAGPVIAMGMAMLFTLAGTAHADTAADAAKASSDAALEQARERIPVALQGVNPEIRVERVERSPVEGLYQVLVEGQVVYVTGDGRYLIQGDMLDLVRRQAVSESLIGGARAEKIAAHGTDNMIIYPAKGETEHVVTVFTDIDCPHCRRFHDTLEDFSKLGIEVRYVQMPRAGEGSESYRKAVSVWCDKDRKAAMSKAKSGGSMEGRSCDNPVSSQMRLARELGVSATPTFVTESGQIIPGRLEAAELKVILDEGKQG